MFGWKKTIFLVRGLPGSGKSTLALSLVHGNRDQVVENDDYSLMPTDDIPCSYRALLDACGDEFSFVHSTGSVEHHRLSYNYIPKMACLAGAWCGAEAFRRLRLYDEVAVANTFIMKKHVMLYVEEAKNLEVKVKLHQPTTPWAWNVEECFKRNIHGVPMDVLVGFRDRFEPMTQEEIDAYLMATRTDGV